jgi:ATP-dependent Lhr-like helicase
VLRAGFAGRQWWAVIEDASRLRDALGVPVPLGVPAAFTEAVPDPLGDLVSRYARTHGPFTAANVAERFGLGLAVALGALRRLAGSRRVIEGEYRPHGSGSEWCDAEVLRRLRRRSLAALRHEVEPVDQVTMGRFLPAWQHVGGRLRGVDGVASVIEQLEGARIPASAWESLVLPARVSDYRPAMLDELTNAGEVLWAGAGTLAGNDGWISLYLAETATLTLPPPAPVETTELQREVLATLGGGGGFFFRQLSDAVGSQDDGALADALWELVWAGLVGNDTFVPVRALLSGGRTAHSTRRAAPRARLHGGRGMGRAAIPQRTGPPTVSGRWSIVPVADDSPTRRAHALGETLLERYGVVTRGAVVGEGVTDGFALVYRTLSGFEDSGRCRRGYFIDGLGAAQFATAGTIDRLRSFTESEARSRGGAGQGSGAPRSVPGAADSPAPVILAATDPANPYGAVLPWPALPAGTTHRAARKAGAIVVLVDGALVIYVERGGKTVLAFDASGAEAPQDPGVVVDADTDAAASWARDARFAAAAGALAATVTSGRIAKLGVETVNGEFVIGTPFGRALQAAGFGVTPKGLKLHA